LRRLLVEMEKLEGYVIGFVFTIFFEMIWFYFSNQIPSAVDALLIINTWVLWFALIWGANKK